MDAETKRKNAVRGANALCLLITAGVWLVAIGLGSGYALASGIALLAFTVLLVLSCILIAMGLRQ